MRALLALLVALASLIGALPLLSQMAGSPLSAILAEAAPCECCEHDQESGEGDATCCDAFGACICTAPALACAVSLDSSPFDLAPDAPPSVYATGPPCWRGRLPGPPETPPPIG